MFNFEATFTRVDCEKASFKCATNSVEPASSSHPIDRNEMHLDRKMSLPAGRQLSALLLALVPLMAATLLMHSGGCTADAAAAAAVAAPPMPRITSPKQLMEFTSNLTSELRKAEQVLGSAKVQEVQLERRFKQLTGRTARHAWKSAREQKRCTDHLVQEAKRFKNRLDKFGTTIRNTLGSWLKSVQGRSLRRFQTKAVSQEITQSLEVYKRIIQLLNNLIECPVDILQHLDGKVTTENPYESTEYYISTEESGEEYY